MKKSEIKNSADMFLYKAIIDFNSAKALYELFEAGKIEIDLEKIYFDLQQSSEKLLKSLLTQYNIVVKKTHDIEDLILTCKENNIELIDDIDELIGLTDFAVDGRYSIICDEIENIDIYFDIIRNLINFLEGNRK